MNASNVSLMKHANNHLPLSSLSALPSQEVQDRDTEHFELVTQAIRYLRAHQQAQPGLVELSQTLNVSESHLQRVFSAWAGVSPKRFLQMLTRQHAVQLLAARTSVLDASLEAGLSSPGRLHDLTVSCDAMTPGEIASAGSGLSLQHGWGASPFGPAFIAWGERGICHLSFHGGQDSEAQTQFLNDWSGAQHTANDDAAAELLAEVFARPLERGKFHLLLRGTNFQVKVWEALLRVPAGQVVSYGDLATLADAKKASRAVGSSMAKNRIAYLIPCHRVIRQNGDWGHYRWGLERKLALHFWENTE